MHDSASRPASCDPSASQSVSPERALAPKPVPSHEEIGFIPLTLYFARDDCYWPQPVGCDVTPEDFLPILISRDLVLRGGFHGGMKLGKDPCLLVVFVDEQGRTFQGQYGSHRPDLVVTFFPRHLVRLRLFSRDLYWERLYVAPLGDSEFLAHVAIAVTDSEGNRHHFTFPVEKPIRRLFPPFLAEVT